MNAHTRLTADGHVVIPKVLRDRLGWQEGAELRIVAHGNSVTLEVAADEPRTRTLEEVLAAIDARGRYTGPRISDEDIERAVREEAARQELASRSPDR